ncbi:hypothetical protein BASA50_003653 [Batrachochytrium salamandrivorans]|uniref:chitin synthase n=1 Tax=Batrachochytrium salamandrivorans TaxID=1357716 RepID=A0ABQ8FKZ6_9FUNG|nr:hypothetical protein BASA50_003653 [Batrachochytrium salamandrivorans]
MVQPGRANIYAPALDAGLEPLDSIEDLSQLPDIKNKQQSPSPAVTAADVATCLLQRLAKDHMYTRIGCRSLVAVRPARPLASNTDAASKEYTDAHRAAPTATQASNSNLKTASLAPHVFGIAVSAYSHMVRLKVDQAIVLLGESASGKSESQRMLVRSLCDLSKASKKKTKIQSSILKVDSIFSAFGNATTPFNANASCVVRYSEIQFDAAGRMVGMKLIESLLEKSRVSGAFDGGHSFHIFYYLLDGATYDERVQWHLSDPAHFRFLNLTKMRTVGYAQGKGTAALDEIRETLKVLGVGRRQQTQLWQLLAAILHLGNVTFMDPPKVGDVCLVRNYPQMQLVADMLGVPALALQVLLTTRSRHTGTEINQRLCQPESDWTHFVSILESPGLAGTDIPDNDFYRLLVNYTNERLIGHAMNDFFVVPKDAFLAQTIPFPEASPFNSDIMNLLSGNATGIIPIVDRATASNLPEEDVAARIYELNQGSSFLISSSSKKLTYAFGVRHYGGVVEYDVRGFRQSDGDILQSEFVTLVRGNPEQPGTSNIFLRTIFSSKLINTRTSARDGSTVIAANNKGRFPSLRRKKKAVTDDENEVLDASATVGHEFRASFTQTIDAISEAQSWYIFHVKTSDVSSSGKADRKVLERQITGMHLTELSANPAVLYTSIQPHADFMSRYKSVVSMWERDPKAACESLYRYRNWTKFDAIIGTSSIFLSEPAWKSLEDKLRIKEQQDQARKAPNANSVSTYAMGSSSSLNNSGTTSPTQGLHRRGSSSVESMFPESFNNIGSSISQDDLSIDNESDSASHYDSEFEYSNVGGGNLRSNSPIPLSSPVRGPNDMELGNISAKKAAPAPAPVKPMSRIRCCWLAFTWSTTFCWLSPCLSICGGMRTRDRQIAWREKFALCIIIFFMNAAILFFIVGLGFFLCPKKALLSPGEVSGLFSFGPKAAVYMYGSYYFIPDVVTKHVANYMDISSATPKYWESQVLGQDVSIMFPRDENGAWPTWCPNFVKPGGFSLKDPIPTGSKWWPHTNKDYFSQLKPFRKGDVVWDQTTLAGAIATNRRFLSMYDSIYEVTPFYNTALNPSQLNSYFLGAYFKNVSDANSNSPNSDVTGLFEFLRKNDATQWNNVMACMNGLFYVGKMDHRNDLKCVIPNYILLGASGILVLIIGFKFLAALQFSSKRQPEDHDKFVICQVPCYTEGEVSLRRTLESLANLKYDDKHKLIFVICDGMIIGSGNDRPTPRIVLDILGVDPSVDPEAVAFHSLGEGNSQLNMGKIYSGLFEINGRVVPFIVVVKVGKPSEVGKPGNRGKRDSQMILMQFLSRVHFNQGMAPLELELFHQMKNVIGVDPSFYEYIFMVDADTQVHQDSLNMLVSHMTRDARVSGTCGETNIANERKSFTSMIQVYEYFISHHLSKAFESLFGSVTCLPGCFSIYRIRTPGKNVPVLIAPGLIADYSENNVDTLHLKNLLHLGEDRYLTTLIMKHFPNMRTTFTADAKCETYAPERWPVLLSQRRRWINSTVHNLLELMNLSELCGFCCFSMRFVVFVDLLATLIQPSALIYLAYLVYASIADPTTNFPIISIIMIACVYGFQVIIFLFRTEWQHIGWMFMYLLAIPLFSFYIPLYSFWHFDDFSWGNTRKAAGEGAVGQRKEAMAVVEEYDPDSVPLMKWSDYEAQRKATSSDKDDARSVTSYQSGYTYKSGPAPIYAESNYGGSVAPSYAGSAYGGGHRNSHHPAAATAAAAGSHAHGVNNMVSLPRSLVSIGTHHGHLAAGAGGHMRAPNAGAPNDEEILREVRHILATTDLMKVTKKSVREQLSQYFGYDLSGEKEYIHRCIDGVLRGEL